LFLAKNFFGRNKKAMGALRTLAGLVSLRWRAPQNCERCGRDFTCGATLTGCWCTEYKLSAEVRTYLRQKYRRCLCSKCLDHFARIDARP
jgi:hypothetical protein